MLELSPVSRRELIRRLQGLGFEGPFSGGKYRYASRPDSTAESY